MMKGWQGRTDPPGTSDTRRWHQIVRPVTPGAPAGIALLAGRIGHVQFADYPGRGAPGTGELQFAPLLAALRESGYQGWLAAEYRPGEAGTQASLGWLSEWRAALA